VGGGYILKGATVMVLEADPRVLRLKMLNAEGGDVFPPFEKKK